MSRARRLAALFCAAAAAPAAGETPSGASPVSAIDWLSRSYAAETPRAPARGAEVSPVTVTALAAPTADAIGLPEAAGAFPADLLHGDTTDALARRLAGMPPQPLPAARDALARLVTAPLDPPGQGGTPGALLLARIDALIRLGRLEEARRLIAIAGTDVPALFARAFDIALLTETENAGCAVLRASPGILPSLPVRIFCLARAGDWSAAALTLETAEALGRVSARDDALLARFLYPDLADGAPPLPRDPAPTPLAWRMLEAIGERAPTAPLPLAFAHADLRPSAGWRTRLEATERLVRAGALPPDRLGSLYRARAPAASGGVWERVAAHRRLAEALDTGDAAAVAGALPRAWAAMRAAGLAVPYAALMAPALAALPPGALPGLTQEIALLAPDNRTAPPGPDRVAAALAAGQAPPPELARSPLSQALAAAFSATPPPPPDDIATLRAAGHEGEALLAALLLLARAPEIDPQDLAGTLALLRDLGLEDTARRAALQLHLLGGDA